MSPSEEEKFIENMDDRHLEQLENFPSREKNALNLVITSLPGQFLDTQSPDRFSDHDIVIGTLKVVIIPLRNLGGRYIVIRRVTMNLLGQMHLHSHLHSQTIGTSMDTQIPAQFKKT